MDNLTLEPINAVAGEVQIPGSKSLSNRILLLAALAQGTTRITNLLDSDDVRHMLTALNEMGVEYSLSDDKQTCTLTGLAGSLGTASKALFLRQRRHCYAPFMCGLMPWQ